MPSPWTFLLLCLALCAVWLPAIPLPGGRRLAAWQPFFVAFLASGLVCSELSWMAVLALGAAWAASQVATQPGAPRCAAALSLAVWALSLALAVHLVPGFSNPLVAAGLRLGEHSPPITQYASLDKGAAGLILVAFFCRRIRAWREWPGVAGQGIAIGIATSVVVLGAVATSGAIAPDPKLPRFALLWVPINLLLTCVAEEAFFRGVLQERLMRWAEGRDGWRWMPILVASVLFGLVHAGGGIALAVAAAIAGCGYGLAYARTRRIESAVLAHFTLNAIHFFGFTYPLASS